MSTDPASADAREPDSDDLFSSSAFVDAHDAQIDRTHIGGAAAAIAIGLLCAFLAAGIVTRPVGTFFEEFSDMLLADDRPTSQVEVVDEVAEAPVPADEQPAAEPPVADQPAAEQPVADQRAAATAGSRG